MLLYRRFCSTSPLKKWDPTSKHYHFPLWNPENSIKSAICCQNKFESALIAIFVDIKGKKNYPAEF